VGEGGRLTEVDDILSLNAAYAAGQHCCTARRRPASLDQASDTPPSLVAVGCARGLEAAREGCCTAAVGPHQGSSRAAASRVLLSLQPLSSPRARFEQRRRAASTDLLC
jgi:hypothetical protein